MAGGVEPPVLSLTTTTCLKESNLYNSPETTHKKGLKISIGKARGRFIKARVEDKGKVVDVIIFDRRTGRIRSIY